MVVAASSSSGVMAAPVGLFVGSCGLLAVVAVDSLVPSDEGEGSIGPPDGMSTGGTKGPSSVASTVSVSGSGDVGTEPVVESSGTSVGRLEEV